ncbi:penicillin-binding protein 2 [Collinsella ihumii]|uniref:penicillin-binding protein 2 n=1 Tax=Collinsella ihumii TaxID=1720204 RepID=UPI00082E91B4|nr:penicillin-binding protein 2 [Collinsella ihumii]
MDAQIVVIIAGIILFVVIIASLLYLRSAGGKFTYDTQHGTRPRATEGEGNTQGTAFKGRFTMLAAGAGAIFTAIIAKLWSMQMVSSDYYEELAVQNQTRTVTTPAPRGRILDRNGEPLVTNRASLTVAAYRDLADDTVLVRHLANVLGMPYIAVRRNIQDYNQGAQSLHTIASDVRRSTVAYIQEHPADFAGVEVVERTERLYPHGELAAHVLGYTGTITQEQLSAQQEAQEAGEESPGTITYESGDIVGQAGVEIQYESLLQGIRGEQTVQVDASGNVTGSTGAVPPEPGSDIKLTLDLKIQQACEDGLQHAMEMAKQFGNENGTRGACVCLDCTNGEILGMASAPKFDPSVFIGGVSNDDWSALNSDDGGHPMINRAIAGEYMSASTIKPFSSLAALEYDIFTSTQTTDCVGWWTGMGEGNGRWCWDHSGHGTINLRNGIVMSCDTVFYEIGKGFYYSENNSEGLQEVFRRWGFGESTGVDLPGESSGRVPDAQWKYDYFSNWEDADRTWNPGDMCNIVIGQGDILVTPLQIACAYAGIANGGKEFVPHVFLSAVSRDGSGDAVTYEPRERLTGEFRQQSDLDLVQDGLVGVIYEESASQASHFTNLSVTVAGKSGTGQKTGEDDYGWFVAYAPAGNPKYVVACLVEQGGFGSNSSLYGVRDVLGAIYDQPDTAAATAGDGSR